MHYLKKWLRRIAASVPLLGTFVARYDALARENHYLRCALANPANSGTGDAGFPGLLPLLHRPFSLLEATPGRSPGESSADIAIIERALRAYRISTSLSSVKPTATWSVIYDTQQAPLHRILAGNDFDAAAALLRRPGDSNIFWGFDGLAADDIKTFGGASASLALARMCQDQLIRVAESIGALRCETPEAAGFSGLYGIMPTDDIVTAIEKAIGCKISFPNPYPDELGVQTSRGVASYRAIHAIYQAWRIRELVRGISHPRVLELGAGLGRTAYYSRQLGISDYTIIDLPFTAVSQGYFLMRTLGEDQVLLQGEPGGDSSAKVKILDPQSFLEGAAKYDLIVNVDSLTEMERSAAEQYWRRIQTAAPLFLSINHESNRYTVKELLDASHTRVINVTRHPYPLRRGYVEELAGIRL